MKKRITEISLMNIFFAMLVILIHLCSKHLSGPDKFSIEYTVILSVWRLASFVVQGFIFLSAFKFFSADTRTFKYGKFYLSRLTEIVIPYIFFSVLYYFLFLSLGFYPEGQNHFSYILHGLYKTNIVGHLYFVIVILQFYLLMPLWRFLNKHVKYQYLLPISLIITVICSYYFPNTGRIFLKYLIFWFLGMCFGKHYNDAKKLSKELFPLTLILFVCCAVADATLMWNNLAGIYVFPYLEYLHILYSILAILFFFEVARKFKEIYKFKVLKAINGASYYIYLSHCIFIYLFDYIVVYKIADLTSHPSIVRGAFVYIASILFSILFVNIKKRIKKHA